MMCVALYRGKSGSVYSSTQKVKRRNNLDPFKRGIMGRVGHLNLVVSLSRKTRDAFCSALRLDGAPVIYSRSSDHTLYSIPHGLASTRVGTLTRGRNMIRIALCGKFLHGGKRISVLSTVRRLGRVIQVVNIRRMNVNASFSKSKNIPNYTSTSRLVGFAHHLLTRQCDRGSVTKV